MKGTESGPLNGASSRATAGLFCCPAVWYPSAMRMFPLRNLRYSICVTAFMAAFYVGAYYALVEREQVGGELDVVPRSAVFYRCDWQFLKALFAPMHAIDRELRPVWWQNETSNL
jgi:hypothetical protein